MTIALARRTRERVAMCCTLAALAACSTPTLYRAPGVDALGAGQAAVLENNCQPPYGAFTVVEIDGRSPGFGQFREFRVAPGHHLVKAEWTRVGWALRDPDFKRFEFDSVPGSVHELRCESKTEGETGNFWFWLQDKNAPRPELRPVRKA